MKVDHVIRGFSRIIKELERYKEMEDEVRVDIIPFEDLEKYLESEELENAVFGLGIWSIKRYYYEPIYVIYEDGSVREISFF
jgi:hypothetical protein